MTVLIRRSLIVPIFFACAMFAQPGTHVASALLALLATAAIMVVVVADLRRR